MAVRSLTTGSLQTCSLRMDFRWAVDRFVQTLLLVNEGSVEDQPILQSVDGDSEQVWPPSPPLQDLNFHEVPAGPKAALAVGMAGKSHWSIAWEAQQDRPELVCDVACRAKEVPGYLASTWKINAELTNVTSESRVVCIRIDEQLLQLGVLVNDEFAAHCEYSDGQVCFGCSAADVELPATFRWRYRFCLAPIHG